MNPDLNFVKSYILNFIFILTILYLGSFVIDKGENLYYKYADIDTFYQSTPGSFVADDACVGDASHHVVSQRFVYKTDTGYSAKIVRELYRVEIDGTLNKVYEKERSPFIEVKDDGYSNRIQPLPSVEAGDYQWIIYFTYINVHGVLRTDVPPLTSNIFEIKECTTNSFTR